MLLTQASRDLYDHVDAGWVRIQAWVDDPANAQAAAPVRAPIRSLRAHWDEVDRSLLSDPDEIDGAAGDLRAAEKYATERGYRGADASYVPPSTTAQHLGGAAPAAESVEGWAHQHPTVDAVTTAKDVGLGARLDAAAAGVGDAAGAACRDSGLPAFVCEHRAPGLGDVPTWVWVTGAGAVGLTALAAYAAWSARDVVVPLGLAAYAPEALPAYRAARTHVNALAEDDPGFWDDVYVSDWERGLEEVRTGVPAKRYTAEQLYGRARTSFDYGSPPWQSEGLLADRRTR